MTNISKILSFYAEACSFINAKDVLSLSLSGKKNNFMHGGMQGDYRRMIKVLVGTGR